MAETEQFATAPLHAVANRVLQPFEGTNHKVMQRLLTGKENGRKVDATRLPLSPKRVMEARLGRIGTKADHDYLNNVYVDTSTAVLPNPNGNGEVRYVHEHPLIYGLTEKSLPQGVYNLPIDEEQYARSEGFTLKTSETQELRNDFYVLPKRRREFWEFQAEGDTKLTADYIKHVADKLGMKFDNVMGLWLPRNKGLRLLSVGRVDDNNRSDVDGVSNLDSNNGRLVGEVAESQLVAKKMGITLDTLVHD